MRLNSSAMDADEAKTVNAAALTALKPVLDGVSNQLDAALTMLGSAAPMSRLREARIDAATMVISLMKLTQDIATALMAQESLEVIKSRVELFNEAVQVVADKVQLYGVLTKDAGSDEQRTQTSQMFSIFAARLANKELDDKIDLLRDVTAEAEARGIATEMLPDGSGVALVPRPSPTDLPHLTKKNSIVS